MSLLILGLALFLGAHSLRTVPALYASLSGRLGANGLRGLVSLASLAGLALIVWGYWLAQRAPVHLWTPPVWGWHLSWTLMAIAFVLLVAAYVPGRIREKVRHPMLAGVKIWAFAHLLANGTLADLVLFGAVLAWAVWDRVSISGRERAGLVKVSGGPLRNDTISLVVGLGLYAFFLLWAHEWLFGVSPIG